MLTMDSHIVGNCSGRCYLRFQFQANMEWVVVGVELPLELPETPESSEKCHPRPSSCCRLLGMPAACCRPPPPPPQAAAARLAPLVVGHQVVHCCTPHWTAMPYRAKPLPPTNVGFPQ